MKKGFGPDSDPLGGLGLPGYKVPEC